MAASVRNVGMRVGMNAERKVDTVIRMNMAVVNNNKEVTEEVINSTAAASPDTRADIMSVERKVDMEEETKMSTVVPVDIREIMEITRTTIAAAVSKEDTAAVGTFPREEAMALVVATQGAMTISAALLSMLNSMLDIPMTAEYIPAS
jgi:hypothetical protein